MVPDVTLIPIDGLPEITPGDDLAAMLVDCLRAAGRSFETGDVLAVAQKVVSKSEGRIRKLTDIVPGPEAERMAAESGKDARGLQAVLDARPDVAVVDVGLPGMDGYAVLRALRAHPVTAEIPVVVPWR